MFKATLLYFLKKRFSNGLILIEIFPLWSHLMPQSKMKKIVDSLTAMNAKFTYDIHSCVFLLLFLQEQNILEFGRDMVLFMCLSLSVHGVFFLSRYGQACYLDDFVYLSNFLYELIVTFMDYGLKATLIFFPERPALMIFFAALLLDLLFSYQIIKIYTYPTLHIFRWIAIYYFFNVPLENWLKMTSRFKYMNGIQLLSKDKKENRYLGYSFFKIFCALLLYLFLQLLHAERSCLLAVKIAQIETLDELDHFKKITLI
ncbi:hypothetical protein ACJX0J_031442 [Zea mays]